LIFFFFYYDFTFVGSNRINILVVSDKNPRRRRGVGGVGRGVGSKISNEKK
jgi:hypothetical protein